MGSYYRLARYPQLYSWVDVVHQFWLLSEEEVRHLLEQHWRKVGADLDVNDFTNKEASPRLLEAIFA